jgi:hypothetical protein
VTRRSRLNILKIFVKRLHHSKKLPFIYSMIRTTILIVTTALLIAGWASARQQELLNHSQDVQMQEMQSTSCSASSSSSGAG